jgi:hypothetical protein
MSGKAGAGAGVGTRGAATGAGVIMVGGRRDGGRPGGLFRQVVEVAGLALLLEGPAFALDVLAEERVHEEGEVEGRRSEVPREQQRVDGLAQFLDLAVASPGVDREGAGEDVR